MRRLLAASSTHRRFVSSYKVKVLVVTKDGSEVEVSAPVGMTLMEAARDIGKVDIEAACDGTCACSTCHVYIDEKYFTKLPVSSEDELDMLDLALKLKATSRLSCQVTLAEELDGMKVWMPSEAKNQLS